MTYAPERELLRTRRLTTIVNGKPMTQIDVCRKVKIPQTTYSAIERGLMKPDPKLQRKLDKLFNLPKGYWEDQEGEDDDE